MLLVGYDLAGKLILICHGSDGGPVSPNVAIVSGHYFYRLSMEGDVLITAPL